MAPESRLSAPGDGSRQRGLPDARHERHFAEESGGFAYRIVVELDPRPGDRLIVRRAVERAARQTIANLEARVRAG